MILFSAGIASFRTATRNQALESDAALVVQVLNIAKINVNNGKKIACNLPLKYWQVKFNQNTFELNEVCEDGSANGQIVTSNIYKLSSANTISASPAVYNFKALGQGATAGTITLGAKTITVTSLGLVQ
jgi:hypothetical protein